MYCVQVIIWHFKFHVMHKYHLSIMPFFYTFLFLLLFLLFFLLFICRFVVNDSKYCTSTMRCAYTKQNENLFIMNTFIDKNLSGNVILELNWDFHVMIWSACCRSVFLLLVYFGLLCLNNNNNNMIESKYYLSQSVSQTFHLVVVMAMVWPGLTISLTISKKKIFCSQNKKMLQFRFDWINYMHTHIHNFVRMATITSMTVKFLNMLNKNLLFFYFRCFFYICWFCF